LVANVINNPIKTKEFYAYSEPLTYDHFHVIPEVNFRVGNQETNYALNLEDWASSYIRITPISLGVSQVLEMQVVNELSLENIDVKIPYIINYFSGNTDVGYAVLRGKKASIFVNGFGKEVSSVVVIPTSQKSLAGFTSDGSSRAVSLRMSFSAANPQTVADLITSIQKQIAGLLEQLAYFRSMNEEETVFRYAWNKNIYVGVRNDRDVEALQKALKIESVYAGPITGNFFSATEEGVKAFQRKHGIEPASGYAGPLTRTKLNSLFNR
jgi:murein L,D-transpeptidase YcbB/YkuD